MNYIDLHCDTLTKTEGVAQVTTKYLQDGGCTLQCFAAFLSEKEGRFQRALALADQFDEMCHAEGYQPVRRYSDIQAGRINAMLTVEEGGAIEGKMENLETLYLHGVRMMTLTWNHPNEIGFPNFPDYEGLEAGRTSPFAREQGRGLTPFGMGAVERMAELGMVIDVSHGSDALFFDVANICKRRGLPFVASHSAAAAVHPWARNLTDAQIQTLANCGGVVGLPFCADFLSEDTGAAGQREALLAHAQHILNVGGEDVLSIGSDFDGIPPNAYLPNASFVPKLLEDFERAFGSRTTEKIASKNAMRVFKEIL